MKVLIGIITRNRATHLPLAIASASEQDYPHKEISVLDIASTDETPRLRAQFPEIPCQNELKHRIGIPGSAQHLLMTRPGRLKIRFQPRQRDATTFLRTFLMKLPWA